MIQTINNINLGAGRLLQVIRARPPLQNAIRDYCATRYGAVHFRLTWASNVVLAALDFVSKNQLIFFKSSSTQGFGAGPCAMLLSKKRTEVKKDKDKTGISTPSNRYTENRELK